ncbi:beta/gamma crystallin family protein [Sandaracinobacter neustonicus]|uniref:Beta/gamma crystallin family protein n=1 Tax=Sandaracinobacter neustonicus TaxID=1715348 RepID=A0A501XIP2_9SPHN|nr:beta/gamma crystallin-related protein [Sandaracinobacter neustonicus]TPE60164.1 beta/gamma crystallin family protein [Sandaracinobacter neustonicus]
MKAILVAVGLAVSAPVLAQSATIYRDTNFSGPAVAVDRANADMRLNFQVNSIRIASGEWELCPEPNFRGRCLTVTRSNADLRRAFGWPGRLQSMRPTGSWGGGPGGPGGPGGGPITGQRLKGMASEYFPAPRQGNSRVLACRNGSATATCAAQTADRFCVDAGWRGAAYQLMETENRRVYLADVLCVRTGF